VNHILACLPHFTNDSGVYLPHFIDDSGGSMAPPYHEKMLSNQVKVGRHLGRVSILGGGSTPSLERQLEDTPTSAG
jgi:hypothetical protein